jgi:hypothetical protein
MLEIITLLAVAVAGYAGAPGWFVLLGAAALLIEAWAVKLLRLHQHPRVPLSTKMITYLVTGVLAGIGLAWLTYLAGAAVRQLLD